MHELEAVEIDRPLERGGELTIWAAGGGGWGDPRDRDPAAVRADVLDGYVSREAAASLYGVSVEAAREEPAAVASDGRES